MRRLAPVALLLLAAGCHREPSFDERYASTEKALGSEAAALDSELAARESEAAAAGATADPSDLASD
jgi:outer membrane murein-binding lipoprotein Lpp